MADYGIHVFVLQGISLSMYWYQRLATQFNSTEHSTPSLEYNV